MILYLPQYTRKINVVNIISCRATTGRCASEIESHASQNQNGTLFSAPFRTSFYQIEERFFIRVPRPFLTPLTANRPAPTVL